MSMGYDSKRDAPPGGIYRGGPPDRQWRNEQADLGARLDQRPDRPEDVPHHGVKFDRGKPQLSQLPVDWLLELAREVEVKRAAGFAVRLDLIPARELVELGALYGEGAKKYEDRNWEKGFDWSRSYNAAFRHLAAFWQGEGVDPETNILHPIAAAWSCFALAWFYRNRPEFDDRPGRGLARPEGSVD